MACRTAQGECGFTVVLRSPHDVSAVATRPKAEPYAMSRSRPLAILRQRCPICLDGKIFRSFLSMYKTCPTCGVRFERESGYFLTAMFFAYAMGFVIVAPTALYLYIPRCLRSGLRQLSRASCCYSGPSSFDILVCCGCTPTNSWTRDVLRNSSLRPRCRPTLRACPDSRQNTSGF